MLRKLKTPLAAGFMGLALVACQTLSEPPPSLAYQNGAELADSTNVVVLVESEQAANTLLINAARRGYQLSEKIELASLDLIMMNFQRPPGVSGDIAIADMKAAEPSATVGVEHLFTIQSNETSDIAAAAPRLYAEALLDWPQSGCRSQIAIGIIDGDVDVSSSQLANVDIEKRNFSNGRPAAEPHGTAIANLLVGPGRLHGEKLYAATVVSDNRETPGAGVREIIQALNWMLEADVKLVNISLAGPYNALLDQAIRRATNRGLVIVAAAGNDGPDAEPQYPAAFSNVIAVTAVDRALEIYNRAVQGDHIDFSAPGVDVFVNEGQSTTYLSGTSVAAPFVTALIASAPFMSSNQEVGTVRELVSGSSVDLGATGPDPVFGRGLAKRTWTCSD
ncbi:MAG: S8 family serine peptidase [Pseudomonadota bacterium]